MKPTVKEIEEYMASLNIPDEQRLNGFQHTDLPFQTYTTPLSEDFNVISKPKHYMLFNEMEVKERGFEGQGVEVRDVLTKLVGKFYRNCENLPEAPSSALFESDYVQLMQYLMRFMDKNGVEDLKKARWYLDKMISSY